MSEEKKERPWDKNPELKKYYNEDYINQVFIENNKPEIQKIAEIHGWSEEKVDRISHYLAMRERLHQQMREDVKARERENPTPTDEEREMGAYAEQIEPQAREAVAQLRKKGYSTLGSGFLFFDQLIALEHDDLRDFVFPDALAESLKQRGVTLKSDSESILLQFQEKYDADELRDIWNEVVAAVPDLGRRAPECRISAAQTFREKHSK